MSKLFDPIQIGNMTVKNRFVRSATHDNYGNVDGSLSEQEFKLYEALAQNQVGLIITAHSYVQHPLGRASLNQNGIYEDRLIEDYRKLADMVHAYGSKLVVQISHAGRQTTPDTINGLSPVAPSPVPDGATGINPRELTEPEILQLIDDYVKAMVRVKASGCDGVQVHMAHGYLLAQFLSPYTNQRTDQWGGSVENRTRILREIITQGRQAVGSDFPILVKLNSRDAKEGQGYLTLEDVVYTAKMLEQHGVDAIEISGGMREDRRIMAATGILQQEQEAYFSAAAKAVKEAVQVPILLVGGVRSKSVMEKVLTENIADLISMSRPFVRDPNLVVRLKAGQDKVTCISCNACFSLKGLACYVK